MLLKRELGPISNKFEEKPKHLPVIGDMFLRKYGNAPYSVVVLHGGPGVKGEVAPLAQGLGRTFGILEPMQTAYSIESQLAELHEVINNYASIPVALIGWSWGAFLAYLFTHSFPSLVRKLFLVSSPVFDNTYAKDISQTQIERLSDDDRLKFQQLMNSLSDPALKEKDAIFLQMGRLISKTDAYDPILPYNDEIIECSYEQYQQVWGEAVKLRKSGKLLELGKHIHCPVVAIHGFYDSRPIEGIEVPLSSVLSNFRSFRLEKCGHHPWFEKSARKEFFEILVSEISQ
jgi:pimeloyl-ACP methyl ester carboxylesterase